MFLREFLEQCSWVVEMQCSLAYKYRGLVFVSLFCFGGFCLFEREKERTCVHRQREKQIPR